MSTITTEQAIPTGTWTLDTVHSSVGYAVRHSGVSLFKGTVDSFDAELADGTTPRQRRRLEHHRQRREPAGAPALAGLLRRRAHPARLLRVDLDPPRRRRADRRGRARDPRRQAADHADRHHRRSRRRPRRREIGLTLETVDRPDELRDELEHGAAGRRLRPRQRGHADREPRVREGAGVTHAYPRDLREPAARLAQPQAPARGGRALPRRHRARALRRPEGRTALRRRRRPRDEADPAVYRSS